jgi:hypothetical protein
VPEHPSYDELQAQITDALERLDAFAAPDVEHFDPVPGEHLLVAVLRTTLLAAGASLGECRQDIPYAPMHPVRKNDGTMLWCCTHDPPHPPDCQ